MSPTLTTPGKQALDAFFNKFSQSGDLPAFIGGATTADGEIYFNGAGKKIVNNSASGDVDLDSVFWICSMTKFLTHISALQLIEKGKLSDETPVADILPQMRNPVIVEETRGAGMKVIGLAQTVLRVKHLLNFSSGLFYPATPDFGTSHSDEYASVHDAQDPHTSFFNILKGDLPGVPLKFEPGTNFVYGYSADVLGFIVEKISGQTLETYMKENIFKPIGIKGSFYLTPDLKEKLLPLTLRNSEGDLEPYANQPHCKLIPQDPSTISCHLGGIGLYMTLRDYLSFLRHLLQIQAGKANSPILSLETVNSLFVPALTEAGAKNLDFFMTFTNAPVGGNSWSNALSVHSQDWPNRRRKGSASWSGWAGTNFWIDPKTGVAGVFGVQLIGPLPGVCDPSLIEAYDTFEEVVYDALGLNHKISSSL